MNVTRELIQVEKEKKNKGINEGMIKSNQLLDSVQSVLPEIAIGTHLKGQGELG